jgi:hypothetical protein
MLEEHHSQVRLVGKSGEQIFLFFPTYVQKMQLYRSANFLHLSDRAKYSDFTGWHKNCVLFEGIKTIPFSIKQLSW